MIIVVCSISDRYQRTFDAIHEILSISDCYYLISTIKLALYLAFEPTTGEQSGTLVRIETCVREIDSWMVSNKLKLNGDGVVSY